MKTAKTTTRQRWLAATEPAAKFCAIIPGAKAAILKRLNQITGKQWNRQQVESYLHRDPKKRQEPRHGTGLALVEAANHVISEHTEDKSRP